MDSRKTPRPFVLAGASVVGLGSLHAHAARIAAAGSEAVRHTWPLPIAAEAPKAPDAATVAARMDALNRADEVVTAYTAEPEEQMALLLLLHVKAFRRFMVKHGMDKQVFHRAATAMGRDLTSKLMKYANPRDAK